MDIIVPERLLGSITMQPILYSRSAYTTVKQMPTRIKEWMRLLLSLLNPSDMAIPRCRWRCRYHSG